ncbi:ATP synthase subunit s, mitochondrial-like [Ctenocephalides felis]|uniref:ATP synthase subunit s, mitochondrial-like n=1 Tax=Ctenocephalides felis TaxID=7515 RepID=UPI000E6E2D29|nr:ATP synthase subunit s, mitochondrial-like [Ctenocephalides felis]
MSITPIGAFGKRLLKSRYHHDKHTAAVPPNTDLLKIAVNTVDRQRLRRYGPERVCAEWILRNGGSVRWHGNNKETISSYAKLQRMGTAGKYLDVIDASGTTIMQYGFLHLRGVTRLRTMIMRS